MKRSFIFLFFLVTIVSSPISLFAQNIDSLLLLRQQTIGTEKVNSYPTQPNNGSIWVNRELPYKNYTPQELLSNVLVADHTDQTIFNVTFTGSGWNGSSWTTLDRSLLYFSHGSLTQGIGIEEGILMTTGPGRCVEGPNVSANCQALNDGTPIFDTDLQNATNHPITSGSILEFDFTPTVDTISFEYVFASEEYPMYSSPGSQFNDVFGFFISGPGIVGTRNIAVVPGTNSSVTITNISQHANTQYYRPNYVPSSTNGIPGLYPNVEYNGNTVELTTAKVAVIPCQTYHLKLAIANVEDAMLASGVFLKAGSLVLSNLINESSDIQTDTVFGGCTHNKFIYYHTAPESPLVLPLYYSGSCVNDVVQPDGTPMPMFVVLPIDSTSIEIPYKVLPHPTVNGGTFTISFPGACDSLLSKTLIVMDLGVSISAPTTDFCDQHVIPIEVLSDILNQFVWSSGSISSIIEATLPGEYSVTAYNDKGCAVDTSITLTQCDPQLILNDLDYTDVDLRSFNQCQWHVLGGFPYGELLSEEHLYWYINGQLQIHLNDVKEWDINLQQGSYLIEEKVLLQSNEVFALSVFFTISPPDIEILVNPTIEEFCEEETIELTAVFDFDITWNHYSTEKEIMVYNPGMYVVQGIHDSTKCQVKGAIMIPDCPFIVVFPNAITPGNKDGLNDELSFPVPERLVEAEIFIYNKYGNLIFHSTDKNFKWNGMEDGKIKGYSNYTYIIYYTKQREGIRLRQQGSIFVY
ncbi:MAG: gliding motility-associated C-terminal domain-containing protein [Bacteroidales bacterium]|jgi:gliding motility-associated-like protein|nr:gliding motility-associated C-terminal domain-containing protein [Bacteroidales bacterium]